MNACATALRRALAAHGGWMNSPDLDKASTYSQARVDDELADMVVAGDVLYNERARQYRLAGSPLARRALRDLLSTGERLRLLASPDAEKTLMRVGLAVRCVDADGAEQLVMADLELPHHHGDPAAVEQMVRGFAAIGQALGEPLAKATV